MIEPHGGWLVNRSARGERAAALEAHKLPVIQFGSFEVPDLKALAIGTFSPLEGSRGSVDYVPVINDKRLASDLSWALPVTLAVNGERAESLMTTSRASLANARQNRWQSFAQPMPTTPAPTPGLHGVTG